MKIRETEELGSPQTDKKPDSSILVSGTEYALDIVNLNKRFKRQTLRSGYTTVKSILFSWISAKARQTQRDRVVHTQAIKDLTMRIPRGASVGIIGKNGSGKSTLLKLITGIYKPDQGYVSVNGRIAALIELGAGFHPDFTGRENLYLAGVMHGLSRAEIDERFQDIVTFAELTEVIDDPVRTYSSGMFMRLGFSLAVHTDPDVLIIDEVLAVGDESFVHRCKDRISALRKAGKTLLLVSHDLDAVERWCDEVLWLQAGEVKDRGDPRRVIDHYREFIERGEEALLLEDNAQLEVEAQAAEAIEEPEAAKEVARWGSREIEITSVHLLGLDGSPKGLFHPEDAARVQIEYKINEIVPEVVFGIGINRADGLVVHGSNTDLEKVAVPALKGRGKVIYQIKRLGLLDAEYTLDIAVHRKDGYPYDYHKGALRFAVRSALNQIGVVQPQHEWIFE